MKPSHGKEAEENFIWVSIAKTIRGRGHFRRTSIPGVYLAVLECYGGRLSGNIEIGFLVNERVLNVSVAESVEAGKHAMEVVHWPELCDAISTGIQALWDYLLDQGQQHSLRTVTSTRLMKCETGR